jgi:hypothetical protein
MPTRSKTALIALAFVLAATSARAQSLTGEWRASAHGVAYDLQVGDDGAFDEHQLVGHVTSETRGQIRQSAPGTVEFVVDDWDPKVVHAYERESVSGGGLYVEQGLPKPDGGVWRLTFDGPDSFTIAGVKRGGNVITFKRRP